MKKLVLILLISVFSTLNLVAQESDTLQTNACTSQIDSLAIKVNQLQHDYDLLYCHNTLNKSDYELQILDLTIQLKIESIRTSYIVGGFDIDEYLAHKEYYERLCVLFDQYKRSIELDEKLISKKMESPNFTWTNESGQISLILLQLNNTQLHVANSLETYKKAIDLYKSRL